jgi:hypothetical protein
MDWMRASMDWMSDREKTRKLIQENRALRAQLRMACTEIQDIAAEQEGLLSEILRLTTCRNGAGHSSAWGFELTASHFFD